MWKILFRLVFAFLLSIKAFAQDVHNPEPPKAEQAETETEASLQDAGADNPVADSEPSKPLDTRQANNNTEARQNDAPETSLQDRDHKAQIWMNWAAWAQAALTLLGIILVWRTLKHSKSASIAAESAAGAAWATAMEAEKTRESQLRAYISVESLGITDSRTHVKKTPPVFYITLKNTGQTPAKNVKIYSQFAALSIDIKEEPKFFFRKAMRGDPIPVTLGPNFPFPVRADYRKIITEEMRLAMWDTEKFTCYCAIVVVYQDIFGKTRRTMAKAKMIKTNFDYEALPISKHNKFS